MAEELKTTSAAGAQRETPIQEIISPAFLKISSNSVQLGTKHLRTLAVLTYPRFLEAGWFGTLINLALPLDISVFYEPVDTAVALKKLQKKITQVEAQILEGEEKGRVRDPVLETAYKDIEGLRDALAQARERMLSVAIYITLYADSPEELDKVTSHVGKLLESQLLTAKPILFQQDSGIATTFPLGKDKLDLATPMNTAPASTTFPFISADLTANEGILYGVNRSNNTLIIFDRFSLENGHMVVFARAGGGKSYATKLEVIRSLMIGRKVIILDPENEYANLAATLSGNFFRIALDSKNHVNPFDIAEPEQGESLANVLKESAAYLMGLFRIMFGQLSATEEALLDRAISQTYASFDITPEKETIDFSSIKFPTLNDFEVVLRGIEGGEVLADKLYPYTQGNFSGFVNHPTDVSFQNRLIIFGIRDLEETLRPTAMYLTLNFIWNNAKKAKEEKDLLIIDEAWWILKYPEGADFLLNIVKRGRKYNVGVTTITQDVEDFLKSPYGRPIINNSALVLLLRQSPAVSELVRQTFNLSQGEKTLLEQATVGEGVFIAGLKHVAIHVVSSNTEHEILTRKPEELTELKEALQ